MTKRSNIPDKQLRVVCKAIKDEQAMTFIQENHINSYLQYYSKYEQEIRHMVSETFKLLSQSQKEGLDTAKLVKAINQAKIELFNVGDDDFWFHQIYQKYKKLTRPKKIIENIKKYIETISFKNQRNLDKLNAPIV